MHAVDLMQRVEKQFYTEYIRQQNSLEKMFSDAV